MTVKYSVVITFILISLNCVSQISFERGYFIDELGHKTECQIRNVDWKNNPTRIEFRISDGSESSFKTIEEITEFGITNESKFIRAKVKIDRSSNVLKSMSEVKDPIYNQEEVVLKVLVEGNANLYIFREGNLVRYFFNNEKSDIEQLIYKKYRVKNGDVATNTKFRGQLWDKLKCSTLTYDETKKLEYSAKDLIHYFKTYNICKGIDFTSFEKQVKRKAFSLSIIPGLRSSSLKLSSSLSQARSNLEFDYQFTFSLGLQAKYILPFNNDKWAIIFEPTYQYFKSDITSESNFVSGGILNTSVDYKSIEFPAGVRYHFYLSDESKIFVDLLHLIDASLNSSIDFKRDNGTTVYDPIEIKPGNNLVVGLGYEHKDFLNFGLRYQTNRTVTGGYNTWSSKYNSFSFVLGYTLL